MSQPSVSTMQFVTTSIAPAASFARISSRSSFGVEPSRWSQLTPDFLNSSRMWIEWPTPVANTTVRRPSASRCQWRDDVADQLRPVHAFGELAFNPVTGLHRHARQVGPRRRIDPRADQVTLRDQFRRPAGIRCIVSKIPPSPRPSPRHGVAVSPSSTASG